jgi:PTS system sucrose-specific IIC component
VPIVPVLGATGLFLGLKGVIFNDTVQAWFGGSVHQVPVALQTLTTVLCDTAFAFLAAFICWSAFKKFGGTPIIGFLIGLMLVSPRCRTPMTWRTATAARFMYWVLFLWSAIRGLF